MREFRFLNRKKLIQKQKENDLKIICNMLTTHSLAVDHIPTSNLSKQKFMNSSQ